jgi:hypothetical protein
MQVWLGLLWTPNYALDKSYVDRKSGWTVRQRESTNCKYQCRLDMLARYDLEEPIKVLPLPGVYF